MTTLSNQAVLTLFHRRCSTRQYDPTRKISETDFDTILECARLSPSSVGSEPWQFLVIQNPEIRAKIKPFSWGMTSQIDDCSHLVIILAKKNARYDSPFFRELIERRGLTGDQVPKALARYQLFQQDHMKVLESERALFDWASKQTYIALGNMLTGAAMLGIDSCPIEGFDYAQMNQVLAEAGLFDPTEYGVSVGATFGYRSGEISPKKRKALREIVKFVE